MQRKYAVASSLHMRNVDDELIVRRRAARHGHSAGAEHREILRQALEAEAEMDIKPLPATIRALGVGRKQTPAEVLQREGRDER